MQKTKIELTREQEYQLRELQARCREAHRAGKPGMIIGQVFGGVVDFAFVNNADARKLQAIGMNPAIAVGDETQYNYTRFEKIDEGE